MNNGSQLTNYDGQQVDRIASVYLFANGLHAVFDQHGQQVPAAQHADDLTLAVRLSDETTRWHGFKTVPGGAKGVVVP